MSPRNKKKWFKPSPRRLNWDKHDSQAVRRRNALSSRWNSPLKAGRALMALANVTTDNTTARKARADALYFFRLHKRKNK